MSGQGGIGAITGRGGSNGGAGIASADDGGEGGAGDGVDDGGGDSAGGIGETEGTGCADAIAGTSRPQAIAAHQLDFILIVFSSTRSGSWPAPAANPAASGNRGALRILIAGSLVHLGGDDADAEQQVFRLDA